MKLKLVVLAVCLSSIVQASNPALRPALGQRPAWGTGGKARIPSIEEMSRSSVQRTMQQPTLGRRSDATHSQKAPIKSESSASRSIESSVLPSHSISSVGSDAMQSASTSTASGLVRSPRDESSKGSFDSMSVSSERSMYNIDDVKDIVRRALRMQHERAVNLAREKEKARLTAEGQSLTAEEKAQLAKERKAALKERDAHVQAAKLGLHVEDAQQVIRRQARDFVNFLDTIPSHEKRMQVKQDFLRNLFGSKSSLEYKAISDAIDQMDRRSALLRTHAQHFEDYLNTLPESAREFALQKQLQNMAEYDRADVDKFVMFLEQLKPISEIASTEPVNQQPTESELFEQEMASDALSIQEESKKHLDLLARQEESIQSWNDKLKKYRAMLDSADADKKPKIDALITKTERELAEMKDAFTKSIEKSSQQLEQHMQDHANSILEFSERMKSAGLSKSGDAIKSQLEQDRVARIEQEAREREARLQAQEQELKDQKEALQKEREDHARQLKEQKDELARKAQELADQKDALERSSSRSPSNSSFSSGRSAGMLSRSLTPTMIHYPVYRLPSAAGSAMQDEPVTKEDQAQKSWKDFFKSGATALASGAQKAKATLSRIAASLPKGSSDGSESTWESSSSDDSSSSSDDEREQEAAFEHREEVSHVEEQHEEDNEPRIDFTGENFSNIG